jgi:uncharacterized protein
MAQRISVTVKPNARKSLIAKLSETEYRLSVHAPAQDREANRVLIELLAQHFDVAKSKIRIVHGHFSRRKLVEIG